MNIEILGDHGRERIWMQTTARPLHVATFYPCAGCGISERRYIGIICIYLRRQPNWCKLYPEPKFPPLSVVPLLELKSLNTRVIVFAMAGLLLGMGLLSLYLSHELREDMERMLGDQQFSAATSIALQVNDEIANRLHGLEIVARNIPAALLGDSRGLPGFLGRHLVLLEQFNAGLAVIDAQGSLLAAHPATVAGGGLIDKSDISAVFTEGKALVGRPFAGRQGRGPMIAMLVPIRDAQGGVAAALVGMTDLDQPNFLDKSFQVTDSQFGGYRLLVAPQYRLIVNATDKRRRMETLPAPGNNSLIDRFIRGYEGSGITLNPAGVPVLASSKDVPVAGWRIGIGLPTEKAFAPVRAMQLRMFWTTLALIFVAGLLTWWSLRRQLQPIRAATRALAEQTQGDRPFPQALPIVRQDEVGQLIGGFNGLLEVLRQREGALQATQANLQATLDALPDLMFEVDGDGRLHACHAPSEDLYYLPPQDFLGRTLPEVLPGGAAAACMAALHEACACGHSGGRQYALPMPAGEQWYEISAARKHGQAQEDCRLVVLVRNISQRKQAEAKLAALAASLEGQVRERTEQLRRIAAQLTVIEERERRNLAQELHDNLGQLLAAIKIKLSLLKTRSQQTLRDDVLTLVDRAREAVQMLIKHWSPPILEVLDFRSAVEWLCGDLQRLYGLQVQAEINICPRRIVSETKTLLFRCARELLINVAKHAGVGEAVLAMRCDGVQLVLVVRDAGCGFDPAPHLRGGQERQTFGLASIYERLLALGGEMSIDSRPGMGSAIRLALPCDVVDRGCKGAGHRD